MTLNLSDDLLSFSRLEAGIYILGGEKSSLFLSDALSESSRLSIDAVDNGLLHDGVSILANASLLKIYFENALSNSIRLLYPRLVNDPLGFYPAVSDCLSNVCDSDEYLLVNSLKTPEFSLGSNEVAPIHWSKTLIVLGSVFLQALKANELKSRFNRVIVVESSPRDLCAGLMMSDLVQIVDDFKEEKLSLSLIVDSDEDSIKNKLRDQTVGLFPSTLFGLTVCSSPISNPSLALISTWLKSPEGISQSVSGALGKEVDEINQLIQSIANSKLNINRHLLTTQSCRSSQPVVLVASGPSLDQALPWLKEHQDKLQIISSGSSLGSLLSYGIRPDAAVFLERSSVVYHNDLLSLVNKGIDLSDIPLIASMTIHPKISSLFGDVIWFHRPLSSTLAFFYEEAFAKLLQSGPHSANAGLESLLHLGHRKILLLGCDFSADKRSYPRSKNALGDSPRNLSVPTMGRNKSTVFSSPSLIDAGNYFSNALKVYQATAYSVACGLDMNGVDIHIVNLNDELARDFANKQSISMRWKDMPLKVYDSLQVSGRVLRYRNAMCANFSKLLACISDPSYKYWSLEFSKEIDKFLAIDESNIEPEFAMFKRLCRLPLTMLLLPLHDSNSPEEWTSSIDMASDNIKWLNNFYLKFFNLLEMYAKSPSHEFDWNDIKEMIEKVC